jgi:glycerate kinase
VKRLVLIAPDSFKGTMSASVVANAMAAGLRGIAVADRCPVADGGEGTMDVLVQARGGVLVERPAVDALGREIRASIALLDDGETGVVEAASASGFITHGERDPIRASTYGTGQLIAAAVRAGCSHVIVAAGGSASTDGGAGAIEAVRDAGGIRNAELTVLSDVVTPFEDAARVFGPQKGADTATVELLTARLMAEAQLLPRDPRGVPGSGAAGGLAGGLWAAFGASIVTGADYVLNAVDFDVKLAAASMVISGEGRVDLQSLRGKVTGTVLARAAAQAVPCHLVVGQDHLGDDPRASSITEAGTVGEIGRAVRSLAAAALAPADANGRGRNADATATG